MAKKKTVRRKPKSTGYRARVRMYRHGLGDCFLLTIPRSDEEKSPHQILIDCGALARSNAQMTDLAKEIHTTLGAESRDGKPRLDVVVSTHEHKDHLSGFNQAREVFNDIEIDAVWMGWTENLGQPEIQAIKSVRKKAIQKLQAAVNGPFGAAPALDGVQSLLEFSLDDPDPEPEPMANVDNGGEPAARKIADALAYLKWRGKKRLRYLEPGEGPFELDGVEGVRVYVLGPPRDPILLKGSEVTEKMKDEDVVYHLSKTGMMGLDSLGAAVGLDPHASPSEVDRYHPFSMEHRIPKEIPDPGNPNKCLPNPALETIQPFLDKTYNLKSQPERKIDNDWLDGFGQLALDLDSDTNNTSLVLAFEFQKTGEVLLFVGDAQVGNWKSWEKVDFKLPDSGPTVSAHDLLRRTVFYKVGHHCSHNATLKRGGLELMTENRDRLVAFVPLDKATAQKQGKIVDGVPKGWDMPAAPLFKALKEIAGNRVVISDRNEKLTQEATGMGIEAEETYIDYFLS